MILLQFEKIYIDRRKLTTLRRERLIRSFDPMAFDLGDVSAAGMPLDLGSNRNIEFEAGWGWDEEQGNAFGVGGWKHEPRETVASHYSLLFSLLWTNQFSLAPQFVISSQCLSLFLPLSFQPFLFSFSLFKYIIYYLS